MKLRPLILPLLLGLSLLTHVQIAMSNALPEFRVKAAFLYNFIAFTEWPDKGETLNLCIYGGSPLDNEISTLHGRLANNRKILVHKETKIENLKNCQVVFITETAIGNLPQIIEHLENSPVLTIADSEGAIRQGVIINMSVENSKIIFDTNLKAARGGDLIISSKLLSLAHKVYQ